jgi:hypothetical protein
MDIMASVAAGSRCGRSRRAVWAVTIAVAFALLAGACGGEMKAPEQAPATGSGAGSGGHAGAVGSTVDAARALHAAAYVLPQMAATASFSAQPPTPSSQGARSSSRYQGNIARCLGQPQDTFATGLTDFADGYDFTSSTVTIQSFASVFATAGTVATHTTIVRSNDYVRCVGQVLDERLDSASATWTLLAGSAVPKPRKATRHVSLRFRTTSGGRTVERYVDIILVYAGRVETTLAFNSLSRPSDPALLEATTNQIAAEVANQ